MTLAATHVERSARSSTMLSGITNTFQEIGNMAASLYSSTKGAIVSAKNGDWSAVRKIAVERLKSVAIIGGALGALYGSQKFNLKTLRYVLAVVLIVATFKLVLI